MSISLDKKKLKRTVIIYLLVSLFLLFFVFVYERFSHGVTSDNMRLSILIPLVFGSLVFMLFYFIPVPYDMTISIWNMSMTTWICGLIIDGIYFIYGTDKSIVHIFYYVGGSLCLISIVLYIYQCLKKKQKE